MEGGAACGAPSYFLGSMLRLGVVAAPVLALGLAVATRATGQSAASAQAGLGTVRFAGGATTSVFSFSPDLSFVTPNRRLSLGATLASVPNSPGYGQLRFASWITTPAVTGFWRLAADVELGGTTLGSGRSSGAGSLTGEALYIGRRWGGAIGAGPTSGWITDAHPVTAMHARARGWWNDDPGSTMLTGSIEPNWFLGSWYTDISATLVRRRSRFVAQVTATGRVSTTFTSRAAILASAELRLSPAWSLNVVGGNALPDPYQGFPATGVLMVGARYQWPLSRSVERPVVRTDGFSATRTADGITLRFDRHDAQSVAVAGDWNGWVPAPLTPRRPDRWELDLPLSPGVYHFSLLVDGVVWKIPVGVPSVSDGFGGRVAVLVVTR